MKHWTGQAAGRVLLTGATGLSAAGCCGNSSACALRTARTTETASRGCATFWRSASAARRGRRDPVRLAGDTLDFWRVEAFERIGSCGSQMKTPTTNDFICGEPERGQDDETGDVEIGPAQLAVEDVAVSRVRLL